MGTRYLNDRPHIYVRIMDVTAAPELAAASFAIDGTIAGRK
ncbi:MAG TPA: hypothetical protein VLX91_00585 [Candidatus Acidoferrales bacterium]|nr:hypothetical protein [Candidatus Acidoferrales bacterium]